MGRRCAFEFRNDDSLNTMCKKKEKKLYSSNNYHQKIKKRARDREANRWREMNGGKISTKCTADLANLEGQQ